MKSDRQRWNRKYRQRDVAPEPVDPIVAKYCRLVQPGRALDIAAGAGQNARYLAEKRTPPRLPNHENRLLRRDRPHVRSGRRKDGLPGRHPRLSAMVSFH
ncbi:MAG: hypothetical protein ABIL58_07240 [Pseudomonadota bacterium]